MKATTQAIQNWINSESNMNQMDTLFTNSVNFTAHETTIEEAKVEFDYVIEQLVFLIENDDLDKLTFHKRNGISNLFVNLSKQLAQIQRYNYNLTSVPNVGNAIISYILSLRDQIDAILFSTGGKGASDYVNESKELIKIKKRYAKLVSEIESVEAEKAKLIKLNRTLTEKIEEVNAKNVALEKESTAIKNLNNQIQTLYNQITANAEDIESKKVTISALHKSAKELEKIFTDSSLELNELKTSSSSELKTFIENKSKIVEDKILEFSTKTD